MPKQINTPTPGQGLVKLFSLKGRYQPVLDEVIVPVVQVQVDAPSTARLATSGVILGVSGAGNQNFIRLINPAGSGTTMTVSAWSALSDLVGDVVSVTLTYTATTGSLASWRDSRFGVLPSPRGQVTGFAGAAGAQRVPSYNANGTWNREEWVLAPSSYLDVIQLGQNHALTVSFQWSEQPLA